MRHFVFAVCSALLLLADKGSPVAAQSDFSRFTGFNDHSYEKLDYTEFNRFLRRYVMNVGMSYRYRPPRRKAPAGTRHIIGNRSISRLEGNRIAYHTLSGDDIKDLVLLRQAYAAMPDRIPLNTLNRREQLAYWLNLHNLAVITVIAERYPQQKLKGYRKQGKAWHRKMMTVMGVPLSIHDIEQNIVLQFWHDPVIIYGLFQGTIGGPSISLQAFTGKNLTEELRFNAIEFVNSNRGLRQDGKKLIASEFYDWMRPIFRRTGTDLHDHLMQYADNGIRHLLATATVKTGYYDWFVADIIDGTYSSGSTASTNPNGLLFSVAPSVTSGSGANIITIDNGGSIAASFLQSAVDSFNGSLPAHVTALFSGLRDKNLKILNGEVRVETVDRGEVVDSDAEDENGN